jgi:hypothetical protein
VIRPSIQLLLVALILGVSAAAPARAGDPPEDCRLPATLPLADGVRDPVFSVLLGLIETDACGLVTRARMNQAIQQSGRPTRIPVDFLHALRRKIVVKGKRAQVTLLSTEDVNLPVPYQILAYKPGRVRATMALDFEEWNLGTLRIGPGAAGSRSGTEAVILEEVRLWGVKRGRIMLDVDGWVDRVLGPRLDDMDATGFALVRWRGELLGVALGYNRDGRPRSGVFSFRQDRILFPAPPPLKTAGAYLRRRLEYLMPSSAFQSGDPSGAPS